MKHSGRAVYNAVTTSLLVFGIAVYIFGVWSFCSRKEFYWPRWPAPLHSKAYVISSGFLIHIRWMKPPVPHVPYVEPYNEIFLPYPLIAAVLMILPMARMVSSLNAKNRARDFGCEKCGYDLRATPNCCPECGTVANQDHSPADVSPAEPADKATINGPNKLRNPPSKPRQQFHPVLRVLAGLASVAYFVPTLIALLIEERDSPWRAVAIGLTVTAIINLALGFIALTGRITIRQ